MNRSSDFDYEIYIHNYDNLRKLYKGDVKGARTHWLKYGKKEGRTCKLIIKHELLEEYENFDWEKYLYNYEDLKKKFNNKTQAWVHWINYGKSENRKYYSLKENKINSLFKKDNNGITYDEFDWITYINNYKDLRISYKTKEEAWCHWVNYGNYEGRTYHQIINSNMNNNYIQKSYIDVFFNIQISYNNIDSINFKQYKNNINNDHINESFIIETKNYDNNIYNWEIVDNNIIDDLDSFIIIIDFPNLGGGTTQFINRIISNYKKENNFIILRNYENIINNGKIVITINDEKMLKDNYSDESIIIFLNKYLDKIKFIFFNHILNHSKKTLDYLLNINTTKITITHDFYLINKIPNPYLYDFIDKNKNNIIDINKFDIIITQNIKNMYLYDNIDNLNKVIIADLPDYVIMKNKFVYTNNTNNLNKIVIGVFGYITEIKGSNLLIEIINYFKDNDENIEIVIFGNIQYYVYDKYYIYNNINELNELLIKFKPNLLLEISLWPETYSYTLTLQMITNLPILYLKKNNNTVIEDRLSKYSKGYPFESIEELKDKIYTIKQDYFYTIKNDIYYNELWNNIFLNKTYDSKTDKNTDKKYEIISTDKNIIYKNNIKIYCIYFPQFHVIKENSISFYENFTDIINLNLLKNNKNLELETPKLDLYNLNNITEYNLENINIIQKQIELLNVYNISGFAIYYYWFSMNTVTNKNMIMEKVINLFFSDELNMMNTKIFFIWANESWSQNPAFGNSNYKIENIYSDENINKNILNLLKYFKHNNYLKIDNKPVLLLYHPWFMNIDNINKFKNNLNKICIENNFNGVYFVLNSMNGFYNNELNFYLNFNYKKLNSDIVTRDYINNYNKLNYEEYIKYFNNISNNNIIHTMVFDFDNRARLYKPDKLKLSTVCYNNTFENKIKMLNILSDKYDKIKNDDIENILLINAWNEWGEQMSIEPSNEYGYYYLNLIKNNLNVINSYEYLFNKYIYNLSNVKDKINYEIRKINNISKINKLIIHIHCYDLKLFNEYFNEYINIFNKYQIIITYCHGDNFISNSDNYIYLKIENKGYDIGGKIILLTYLYNNNINFEYILFLHSKSDNIRRHMYINPFYKNISYIEEIINSNNNIFGIFPNIVYTEDKFFYGDINNRNDILKFLNCKNFENIFIEGNVMILKKNVLDYIFKFNLNIFYNILNNENSFDINWFKHYNSMVHLNNREVTLTYLNDKTKYFSNEFQLMKDHKHLMLKDCMIEHVFERIWLNIIKNLNGEFILLQ